MDTINPKNSTVSQGKGAKTAKLSLEEYIVELGSLNIPVVDYTEEDLLKEVALIKKLHQE